MNSDTLVQKMMRMHLPPEDMFRKYTHLYSAFDERGIPTHDASGNELHKSTIKKLSKDWDKQYKLYHTPLDE
jgi:cysteinyl-tRNA synthetase